MKIKLTNVLITFPKVFTEDKFGKFSVRLLIDKNGAAKKELDTAIESVGKSGFGDKWPLLKKELQAKDKLVLHDGDLKPDYGGHTGHYYVNASSKVRPQVRGQDAKELTESEGKIYSGCYADIWLDLYPQVKAEYQKLVCVTLLGIQFRADGEVLSGGARLDESDFKEITGSDADALV